MKIKRTISINEKIWELLDKISKENNRSKSSMIEELIKNYK